MPSLKIPDQWSKTVVLLMLLSLLFSACSYKSESEIAVFKALDESLVNSNRTINNTNEIIYTSLREKLTDPAVSDKARIWEPKAARVVETSSLISKYIEDLKVSLKKQAELKVIAGNEYYREDDKEAVNTLFFKNGKGKELFEKLTRYGKDVLNIDVYLDSAFSSVLSVTTQSFDHSNNNEQEFADFFFENIPAVAAISLLNKFQNNIKVIENKMLLYCIEKCTFRGCIFNRPAAIVAQNISYVRAGDKIEITAGVGNFSYRQTEPEIIINGKQVKLDATGVAVSKIKASGKPGKHFIPVIVSYFDEDGKRQTVEKKVEYAVTN